MAVVMPHGVLFRGFEEKTARMRIVKQGILDAVIGLPEKLFYGTGIPACILVINKAEARSRKEILLINADREYQTGKNQNFLGPEDVEKITHVYRNKLEVPNYSRLVPISEIEAEGFNLNIRRYVDNAPPPEPHDVRAHLYGGIPKAEVDALATYFENYIGLRELLFQPRDLDYLDFTDAIVNKADIKPIVLNAPGVQEKHAHFATALDEWWQDLLPTIDVLAYSGQRQVFQLRRQMLATVESVLLPHNLLGRFQLRGAIAAYFDELAADFQSIAASGWNAELIPDEVILQSQFPEQLAQLEADKDRIAEIEALLESVELDDEEALDDFEEDESGVLPQALVKRVKESAKEQRADVSSAITGAKNLINELHARAKTLGTLPTAPTKSWYLQGLTSKELNFEVAERLLRAVNGQEQTTALRAKLRDVSRHGIALREQAATYTVQVASNNVAAAERKALEQAIKTSEETAAALTKEMKQVAEELYTVAKAVDALPQAPTKSWYTEGLTLTEGNFAVAERVLALVIGDEETADVQEQLRQICQEGQQSFDALTEINERLEKHEAIVTELRTLKANVKTVQAYLKELADAARERISEREAKELITNRLHKDLESRVAVYSRSYQRNFIASLENLWEKYAVTLENMLTVRSQQVDMLNTFLLELGYE